MRTKAIALVFILNLLSGCSSVRVYNATLEPSETQFVFRIIPDKDKAAIISTTGVGFTFGQTSASIGYMDETMIILPDATSCRAFILVKNNSQVEELKKIMKNNPNFLQICTITLGDEK